MKKVFTIGIDGRFFAEAGPGRYVKNIVEHLEKVDSTNKYKIFLLKKNYDSYQPKNKNFQKVVADYPWYSWSEQTGFLIKLLLARLDLLYVPHFNIPILYMGKIVTAIPDIIMHTYSTEQGTTLPKFYFKFKKFIYKWVLMWALVRSKKIIVPTYDVYNDITKYYPSISKDKFVVAYEGLDPDYMINVTRDEAVLSDFGLQKNNYLLYVSSMYEHKNVDRLVLAFAKLVKNTAFKSDLVIIGKKDKFSEKIQNLVGSLGLAERIHMPGQKRYIKDSEVTVLRKNALLYVFPSLKEGFSLTPLEAQYWGLPCIVSNISCHKEVYQDSVEYFDPYSVDDMADKIAKLLSSKPRMEELKKRGFAQVKKYDWLDTAKSTLQVFNYSLNSQTKQ